MAVCEDEFSGNEASLSPSVYGFCGDRKGVCELIDGVDFFGLRIDRLCEPAAQPGDENSEVVRELFTFYQALVYCFFGLKTGDAEAYEIKRVLPTRLDNFEELLGGVQLLSALLFGREAKLRQ